MQQMQQLSDDAMQRARPARGPCRRYVRKRPRRDRCREHRASTCPCFTTKEGEEVSGDDFLEFHVYRFVQLQGRVELNCLFLHPPEELQLFKDESLRGACEEADDALRCLRAHCGRVSVSLLCWLLPTRAMGRMATAREATAMLTARG